MGEEKPNGISFPGFTRVTFQVSVETFSVIGNSVLCRYLSLFVAVRSTV